MAEGVGERIATSGRLCVGDSSQGDDRPLSEHVVGGVRAWCSTDCKGSNLTANSEGESSVDLIATISWIESSDDVMSTFDSAIGRIDRDSLCSRA